MSYISIENQDLYHALQQIGNLFLYSTTHSGFYWAFWPYDEEEGGPVHPARLVQWLSVRKLGWPCFCTVDGKAPFCTFVKKPDECRMAYCGQIPSKCSFQINLSSAYLYSANLAEFPEMIPGQHKADFERAAVRQQVVFQTEDLERCERIQSGEEDGNPLEAFGYLVGWIGEYTDVPQDEHEWEPEVYGWPTRDNIPNYVDEGEEDEE